MARLPTFIVFKNGSSVSTIRGANPRALRDAVQKLSAEAESSGSAAQGGFGDAGDSGATWLGATLPKNYTDITSEVDILNLDLLNASSDFGNARTLFEGGKPSSLLPSSKQSGKKKDWVESDTDEQLMLFVPFRATLKVHSLQITSLTPSTPLEEGKEAEEEEPPMRPKTLKIYSNRPNNLGFEEADDMAETQMIELQEEDWDRETGTANVELRFVKFQNATSLVIYVVDGEGDGEKVRVDRVRIIGETGEKREMGKLQKVGDESGE